MSKDKMREEFEAWVISNWPNQSLGRFNPLHGVTEGEYTGFTVKHCWEAWQASREALVIARPEDFTDGGSPKARILIAHHREIVARWVKAIEALGLKVKS